MRKDPLEEAEEEEDEEVASEGAEEVVVVAAVDSVEEGEEGSGEEEEEGSEEEEEEEEVVDSEVEDDWRSVHRLYSCLRGNVHTGRSASSLFQPLFFLAQPRVFFIIIIISVLMCVFSAWLNIVLTSVCFACAG